ncbi:lectin, galactoside-binding, soluble, 9 (galectin 9)-like 1 [Chiloscyllium plagiosum]|uniref:lectin, galactoside-binding, soluble, 9 (galectin 9)-like 1 n=1 Tax=Chiloscyllium plagiosum TaxID=36176 RepID=UPI001CB83F15|nr:lectin, galactoside-binding, soluble, 9 (galectin 9)-like 1 [Chiloscyllium plagiosum]
MSFVPSQPVYNPSVPYIGPIPGGLQDGKMIMIKGRVLPQSNRFHVNLQCGSVPYHCDVAFHFNPRFENPGYVVCNTYKEQCWSSEERKQEMPIQRGESFQILILVQADCYKVAVNDKHFLEFKHRIPISRVDSIFIDGQVEIVSISFPNNNTAAMFAPPAFANPAGSMFPPTIPANPAGSMFAPPAYASPAGSMFAPPAFPNPAPPMFAPPSFANLQVPFKAPIQGGFFVSRSIAIQGTVAPNCGSFSINLKPSTSPDIAFHISPRFRTEKVVVRNSYLRNSWGTEERALAENPLSLGQPFEITILCEQLFFRVTVNGRHAFDFNHRYQPIQQINELQVEGDVTLSNVSV